MILPLITHLLITHLRILVCYVLWFLGHRGIHCFTNATQINYYLWTSTGELLECMAVRPKETPWGVQESRMWHHNMRHCQCHG